MDTTNLKRNNAMAGLLGRLDLFFSVAIVIYRDTCIISSKVES